MVRHLAGRRHCLAVARRHMAAAAAPGGGAPDARAVFEEHSTRPLATWGDPEPPDVALAELHLAAAAGAD